MKLQIFLPLISFLFKFVLYLAASKIRNLNIPTITCALAAGASMLFGAFTGGVIPLPEIISFAMTIGIGAILVVRNSDAEIYPDGIGIPFAVEIVAAFGLSFVVVPLIELIIN